MGTQFSSRITASDSNRIKSRISEAIQSVVGKPQKGQAVQALVETLPPPQARKLERGILGNVLAVAEERQFSQALLESKSFDVTLDWLKSLRNDADFQGFENIIQKYHLEQSNNPSKVLGDVVRELTKEDAFNNDAFKKASTNAAVAVLAEAMAVNVRTNAEDTPAQVFGKRLGTFNVKSLIKHYLSYFIHAALVSLIQKAAPASQKQANRNMRLADRQAERVSNRVVNTLQRRGKMNDVSAAKDFLVQELGTLLQPKKRPATAKKATPPSRERKTAAKRSGRETRERKPAAKKSARQPTERQSPGKKAARRSKQSS